jgi:hypothetical protein
MPQQKILQTKLAKRQQKQASKQTTKKNNEPE